MQLSTPNSLSLRFPHSFGRDEIDISICPRCFATIGFSTWQADLERVQNAHFCDEWQLEAIERAALILTGTCH